MTKTQNYQLPQWEATDPVRREDFNAAMAALDAGLETLGAKADGVSDAAAQALEQARQELSAQIGTAQAAAQGAQAAADAAWSAGNPGLVCGSYVGAGGDDYGSKRKITVGFTPHAILITDEISSCYFAASGQSKLNYAALTWDSDGVTLTEMEPDRRLDHLNRVYHYCAFR